jgi:hypothetical protein
VTRLYGSKITTMLDSLWMSASNVNRESLASSYSDRHRIWHRMTLGVFSEHFVDAKSLHHREDPNRATSSLTL